MPRFINVPTVHEGETAFINVDSITHMLTETLRPAVTVIHLGNESVVVNMDANDIIAQIQL